LESGQLADPKLFHLIQPVFKENELTPGAFNVTKAGSLEIRAVEGLKSGIYSLEMRITDTKQPSLKASVEFVVNVKGCTNVS
jgi:hypothetical protein